MEPGFTTHLHNSRRPYGSVLLPLLCWIKGDEVEGVLDGLHRACLHSEDGWHGLELLPQVVILKGLGQTSFQWMPWC